MKKNLLVFSTLLLATLACNAVLPQQTAPATFIPTQPVLPTLEQQQPQQEQNDIPQTEAEVPRVSAGDAKAALDSGEAVIVDVRNAEAYAESHIAGAIFIPLGDFETNLASVPLDKNQWIITYCT